MYFIISALTSNWCEIPLYFFPHLNLRACQSKMALFQKTTYTICFISVSDACTWQAIKIEENFQKSPHPTQHQRVADLSQDGGGLCTETITPRPQGNNNRKPFHIGAT